MAARRFDIAGMVSDKRKGQDTAAPAEPAAPATGRGKARKPAEKGSSKATSARTGRGKGKAPEPTPAPAQDNSGPAPAPEATATPAPAPARAKRGPVDPPEPAGIAGERRINLPLQAELHRALAQARIDDGVEATIRLRAMVELWRHDPTIQRKVDRLAKKRATTLQRGRPRKDAAS